MEPPYGSMPQPHVPGKASMNFITNWLTERSRIKILGERYQLDQMLTLHLQAFLGMALREGATTIVLGEPASAHPPLDRSRLEPTKPDPVLEDLQRQLIEAAGAPAPDLFSREVMPVWWQVDGIWKQADSVPLQLVHWLLFHLEGLQSTAESGLAIEWDPPRRIWVTVRLEPNFHLALDLRTA